MFENNVKKTDYLRKSEKSVELIIIKLKSYEKGSSDYSDFSNMHSAINGAK
jgi:hypothetical protein